MNTLGLGLNQRKVQLKLQDPHMRHDVQFCALARGSNHSNDDDGIVYNIVYNQVYGIILIYGWLVGKAHQEKDRQMTNDYVILRRCCRLDDNNLLMVENGPPKQLAENMTLSHTRRLTD